MGLQYYFGYTRTNGEVSPLKFVKDRGSFVGGKFEIIGEAVELTHDRFYSTSLLTLSALYPFKEPE